MHRKSIIFGIKGTKISLIEKNFFKIIKPWGIILFSRNINNLEQLKNLVKDIKNIFKDENYPILIDQEGGAVSRLTKIIDFDLFSQEYFGKLYKKEKKIFFTTYKIYIDTVSQILKYVGININTCPVLDVRAKNYNDFIGDRSFSTDPDVVKKMGSICVNLYKKNKIVSVIKHIPGHGSTKKDSHFETPIIYNSRKKLINKDFKPFKHFKSLLAMTSHVIYKSYDPINACTHSKIIIEKVIRNHINYKGLIISDDISMKALQYNLEINAKKALEAGCNLVLHCNGNIKEMRSLSKVVPFIDKFTQKKTKQFYKFLG